MGGGDPVALGDHVVAVEVPLEVARAGLVEQGVEPSRR
jgi:hypothetical protein